MTDQARTIAYNIMREYPGGVCTFGNCRNGCGRSARGAGECAECQTADLATHVGADLAERWRKHCEEGQKLLAEIGE